MRLERIQHLVSVLTGARLVRGAWIESFVRHPPEVCAEPGNRKAYGLPRFREGLRYAWGVPGRYRWFFTSCFSREKTMLPRSLTL
jgi:hypothetical protein